MDKTNVINIAKDYKELISRYVDFDNVYLFGSHAKGYAKEFSDIDIAVVVEYLKSDYMQTVQMLWKLRNDIDVRIEPHLIVRSNDIPCFYDEIVRSGILIS
ncbi:MAG: nucleotidyltransferase domain-containing protein [bacterium]